MRALFIFALLTHAVLASAYTVETYNPATDKGQDFTTVAPTYGTNGMNYGIWNHVFGNGFQFTGPTDGLLLSSTQAAGFPQSGMMQYDTSCSAGFGYGTFHWRARAGQAGQGAGINLILWRADGQWQSPGLYPLYTEMDVMESWDGTNTFQATMHWNNSPTASSGGQQQYPLALATSDLIHFHDFDFVWGASSIAEYVDGVLQFNVTGEQVPADYAHGGCNETLGNQIVTLGAGEPLPSVEIYLQNSWWRPPGVGSLPLPPPTFNFMNANSAKCIDVTGGVLANGTQIQLWTCSAGDLNQRFSYTLNADSSVTLQAGKSPLFCIDSGTGAVGASVVQNSCTGGLSQKFIPVPVGNGYFSLKSEVGNNCLDVAAQATTSGAQMVMAVCNGGASQQFSMQTPTPASATTLKNASSQLCLDVAGGSTVIGTQLQQATCMTTPSTEQLFNYITNSDGTLTIQSGTNPFLCLSAAATSAGSPLIETGCNQTIAQHFTPLLETGGNVSLQSLNSTYCIDLATSPGAAGTKMVLNTCSGGASQSFAMSNTPWVAKPVSFMNSASGRCWVVFNGSTVAGAEMQLLDCAAGNKDEGFTYVVNPNGNITIHPQDNSSLCLGAYPPSPGSILIQGPCNGAGGEQFTTVPAANGLFSLKGSEGSVCVDLVGGATANGTALAFNTCNGSASQLMSIVSPLAVATTNLKDVGTGDCLDITGGSVTPGTTMQQWICSAGNPNQSLNYTFNSAGHVTIYSGTNPFLCLSTPLLVSGMPLFENACNQGTLQSFVPMMNANESLSFQTLTGGYCLDVAGASTAVAAAIIINTCNGSASQQFSASGAAAVPGVGRLVNSNSGKCIDVPSGTITNGAQLQQSDCSVTDPNEMFGYVNNPDGTITLHAATNASLCLNGLAATAGTPLVQSVCNQTSAQKFLPMAMTGGAINLQSTTGGLCVDVTGSSTADGALLVMNTCSTSTSQQFSAIAELHGKALALGKNAVRAERHGSNSSD